MIRLVLVAALVAPTNGWAHGWRDQYVRVNQKLSQGVANKMRQLRRLGEEPPADLKKAAKEAVKSAERVHHAKRHNAAQEKKPEHERRKLMTVDCDGTKCTVNGVELSDMSLFDCPWQSSLHPYLDLEALDDYIANGTPEGWAVDGGLCLPYQEIPFPYSIGYHPVDTTAANIHCPGPDWNPDTGECATGPGTCKYDADDEVHGGATGVAENYGCAAGAPGWPSSSTAEMSTPICKTYVDDCKYSNKEVRKYEWSANTAGITEPGQGFSIDWVLSEVGPLRNSLGAGASMDDDLTAAGIPTSGFQFPALYDFFWNVEAGAKPPMTGHYPHAFVKGQFGDDGFVDTSKDGTCDKMDAATQWMDCGIPCPVGPEARMSQDDLSGFGIAVLVFMFVCSIIGVASFLFVGRSHEKFFVGDRNLNIFVITATLASQSLDGNAALGNIDLGYFYHWWDGACLPLGLGLSLVLNGIFFAKPLNEMNLLTLPDLFARKFGPAVEVLFSVLAIVSFLCLLGGNLVGVGRIIAFIFFQDELDVVPGIWIATFAIWLYTISGGLISVAYTDVLQALIGWTGLLAGAIWVSYNMPTAAGISPAYPIGDVTVNDKQMTDPDALDPIPNAIFFNWVTIFVLGFGNLAALDFQARVFSAKTPRTAVVGCIAAGIISWIIGMTFSLVSGAARALYGPSSPYAEYVADSCSKEITVIGCFGDGCEATVLNGVPTCGEWKPDPYAPLRMLTCTKEQCHYMFDFDGSAGIGELAEGYFPMNAFIGGWILIAITAASMSTGDGAILAMSTVFAHNLLRKVMPLDDSKLLIIARAATIIWAPIAAAIASSTPNLSGYLLIVAFDIMLAGSVVPMFAAVYWKGCTPLAAFVSMLGGSLLRFVLEFALPKDYLLLLVGKYALSFGPGSYAGIDVASGVPFNLDTGDWCPQYELADYTGLDSLVSPAFSLLLLVVFSFLPSPKIPMFTPVEATSTVAVEGGTPKESTTA